MTRKVLLGALIIASVASGVLAIGLMSEPNLSLDVRRFYLDAFKAVGIGFLVAVLGVVIPHMLPEARDRFDRFKESRIAYSQAKTAIIYLPATLASMDFVDAVSHVRGAHEKLHLAETYKDELPKHLEWYPNPAVWSEQMYWEVMAARAAVESLVADWPTMSSAARLNVLSDAVESVRAEYDDEGLQRPKEAREARVEGRLKLGAPATRS